MTVLQKRFENKINTLVIAIQPEAWTKKNQIQFTSVAWLEDSKFFESTKDEIEFTLKEEEVGQEPL